MLLFRLRNKTVPQAALRTALVLAALGLLSGCGTSGNTTGADTASGSSPSMTERFSRLFSSPQAKTSTPGAPTQPADLDCPAIDIRSGASTYSVSAPGIESPALALRYQGVIGQTARECAALGGNMRIKLGIQGRVILGPAGAPEQVDMPMRVAVVQEGPEPKTIWTKFYRIPVALPAGNSSVSFVHVEDDLTFPVPKPAELENYVIYIGFDPLGMPQQAPRGKKPERRR